VIGGHAPTFNIAVVEDMTRRRHRIAVDARADQGRRANDLHRGHFNGGLLRA
jgi:hypothetical protein